MRSARRARLDLPGQCRRGGRSSRTTSSTTSTPSTLHAEDVVPQTPAEVPEEVAERIRELSVAFLAAGCEETARVDFFLTEAGDILINEINTMPGFTPTSMYPRMWAASGIRVCRVDRRADLAGDATAARSALASGAGDPRRWDHPRVGSRARHTNWVGKWWGWVPGQGPTYEPGWEWWVWALWPFSGRRGRWAAVVGGGTEGGQEQGSGA